MIKKISIFFISCWLLCFPGCGGGTEGTGGITFAGRLLSPTDQPVSGVTVTIQETGDMATSDGQGNYSLATSRVSQATLLFEAQALSAQVVVADIPTSAVTVTATFTVDRQRNKVSKRSVVIDNRGSNHGGSGGSGSGSSSSSSDDNSGGSGGGGSSSSSSSGGDDGNGHGGGDDNGGSSSSSSGEEEVNQDVRGILSAISATSLTVAGVTFQFSSATEFRGQDGKDTTQAAFTVGDPVRVKGKERAGVITADRVEFDD